MSTEKLTVRPATREDAGTIMELLTILAEVEKRPQDVTGNAEQTAYWLFERKAATAHLAEWEGQPVGLLVCYPVYETLGAHGCLHVEDVVVKPEFRGQGIGKKLMQKAAALALEMGYPVVDWLCLDWNRPSMDFYKGLGGINDLSPTHWCFDEATTRQMADAYDLG